MLLLLVPQVDALLLAGAVSAIDMRARLGTEPPGLDVMEAGEMGEGHSRSENEPPSSPLPAADRVQYPELAELCADPTEV